MKPRTWMTGVLAVAALAGASCVDPRGDSGAPAAGAGVGGVAAAASAPALAPGESLRDGVIVSPSPNFSDVQFTRSGWTTDFTRRTVAFKEIQSGGPPKDGIPPIDRPNFTTTAEGLKYLDPDEPVIVLQRGTDTRAYPLQILLWHEIVNDTVGGEPIVITYCPLCNTALAFRRTVAGVVLDFGTTGNLRKSDLVMYDRQTESWWQQITGEGIVGTYAGVTLEFVPASILSYRDVAASYPDARILTRETGHRRPYGRNPYVEYDGGPPFLFTGPQDTRLRATERVLTVALGAEAVAYPFPVLDRERVVSDQVAGVPIVVFFKPGTRSALDAEALSESRAVGSAVAFSRVAGGRVLTFESSRDGAVDTETQSRWDITGRAVSGPLSGARLTAVVHGNHFWFAWAVFRPETRVYQGR